jgi:3-deoxy-7-phosphoheptulonate synthase
VMIDCSHANSRKEYKLQMEVAADVSGQLANGDDRIMGVMVESHLNEGKQDHTPGCTLEYGKSITDPCLGWDDTVKLLDTLAAGVRARRLRDEEVE